MSGNVVGNCKVDPWYLQKNLFESVISSPELGIEAVTRSRLVCKAWKAFIDKSDNYFWRRLLERDYGIELKSSKTIENAFEVYRQKFRICKNIRTGKYTYKVFENAESIMDKATMFHYCAFTKKASETISVSWNMRDNNYKIKVWELEQNKSKDFNYSNQEIDRVDSLYTDQLLVHLPLTHTIERLDTKTGHRTKVFEDTQNAFLSLPSPDDVHLALTFSDAFKGSKQPFPIKIVNLIEGKLKILDGHLKPITKIRFNLDGSQIISSSHDGTVKFWDVESGNLSKEFHHNGPVNSFDLKKDRLFTIISQKGLVTVWDINSGERITNLQNDQLFSATTIKASRNGKRFFTSASNTIIAGDLDSQILYISPPNEGFVRSLRLSPDEKCIISIHSPIKDLGSGVKFWDSKSLACLHTIKCEDACFSGSKDNLLLTVGVSSFRVSDFDENVYKPTLSKALSFFYRFLVA